MHELKRYDEAIAHYDKALSLKPDFNWIYGDYQHTKMKICDWNNFNSEIGLISDGLSSGKKITQPLSLLALIDAPLLHKQSTEIYTTAKYPANHSLGPISKYQKKDKIRVGYYSADFHNHATAYLMAEFFELHNKSRFELIAFSFGPDVNDEMRQRTSAVFSQFIDVKSKSDIQVAQLSRDLGIDIAVDLKGFTQDARTGIFAYRAAPVQVSYLGYPGTMGCEYVDYIVADKTLIPTTSQQFYSEKIVYLPNSYQVNDRKRLISERQFSRGELGLPDKGFVFACFNNNYKITPSTFGSWMRILKTVEGSVLWLLQDNAWVVENLRKEAQSHGVDEKRLLFAERMALPEHLSRHRQADLFLDTFPYNAHTTTSDALWSGLPVLTLMGESFASRVAASLLNAISLPELITTSQEAYEALSIELAMNPKKLAVIKSKLAGNYLTTPLFDTPLFTKNIEAAYECMYEQYHADLQPTHLFIN